MRSALDTDPTIQARLSAWAWERCEEAATTGKLTLAEPGEDGQPVVIDLLSPDKDTQNRARNYLSHIRWLAGLSAKKRPRTALPEGSDGFRMPETG